MTTEELLQPRIIVENNYPRSPFKHYEIICEPSQEQIEWAKEFTQNFRFLNWWEEREVADMPEYYKWGTKIYKRNPKAKYILSDYDGTLPATEQEYNAYRSK